MAYAFGKLVNGAIADRVRVSRFLALGLAISAVMNILMGLNTLYLVACALWVVNGYAQGVGAATSVRSLTQWFSGRERGRAYGVWSAAHSLGEGATLIVTASMVVHFGWRAGFLAPGIACLIVAAVALLVLRDRPQAYGLPEVHEWKGEPHTDTTPTTRAAQLDVLRNPAIWICALASALLFVTRYGVKSWGVLYLQEARGYTLPSAAASIAINTVSGMFGSVAYGFVSDLLFAGRRPPATLVFGILEVISLLVLFHGPRNPVVLTAALFVYGFTLAGILAVLGGLLAVDVSSSARPGWRWASSGSSRTSARRSRKALRHVPQGPHGDRRRRHQAHRRLVRADRALDRRLGREPAAGGDALAGSTAGIANGTPRSSRSAPRPATAVPAPDDFAAEIRDARATRTSLHHPGTRP